MRKGVKLQCANGGTDVHAGCTAQSGADLRQLAGIGGLA